MANNIELLRDQLFKTLEALNDKESPMEIGMAKAVAEVAQVIINSAKVEVEHMKVAGGNGVSFFNCTEAKNTLTGPKVITHRLGG